MEGCKGAVCYDSSPLRPAIPWNMCSAIGNFLCLLYRFLAVADYLAVKAIIDNILQYKLALLPHGAGILPSQKLSSVE